MYLKTLIFFVRIKKIQRTLQLPVLKKIIHGINLK